MSLAERRWLRLFTFCILYAAQGIPYGFLALTLPAYITARDVPKEALATALAMTTLPYTFKWIWGPVMDLVTIPSLGRRRPWIVLAQLMMAGTVLALFGIDPTRDLELLALIIFVHAVFNSMQDVAVDALAIDLLADDERGRANGLMYACKFGGSMIGAAGMGYVVAATDLSTALLLQAGILLAILGVPLLLHERTGPPPPPPPVREVVAGLAQVATLRTTLVLAIMMLGITLASGVLTVGSFGLYIGELQWTAEDYTSLAGGLGYITGFGGALLGGTLADLIGRKRLVALASLGLAAGWIVFAAARPLWEIDVFVGIVAVWSALCQSMMIVGSFALCMDATWARVAATQFAAFMALQAMSTTLGYKLGPLVFEHLSYREAYAAAGVGQLVLTSLLLLVQPAQVRELPRAGAPSAADTATGIATIVVFLIAAGIVPVILLLL